MMMNKFISIDSATVIITIIMSLTSTLWAVVLPTASAADDNSSSCKVARYGFALNSDLQELQANFNGINTIRNKKLNHDAAFIKTICFNHIMFLN